jgi:hypothetical protein
VSRAEIGWRVLQAACSGVGRAVLQSLLGWMQRVGCSPDPGARQWRASPVLDGIACPAHTPAPSLCFLCSTAEADIEKVNQGGEVAPHVQDDFDIQVRPHRRAVLARGCWCGWLVPQGMACCA